MEYFLGSLITFVLMFIFARSFYNNDEPKRHKSMYRYSQRNIHYIVRPFLPPIIETKKIGKTQSRKHFDKTNVRIVIVAEEAFWIKDNTLYTAKMTDEGLDKETTSVVDTMSMDKVQLDKMLFIIDQLRDGKTNDSWSPGND